MLVVLFISAVLNGLLLLCLIQTVKSWGQTLDLLNGSFAREEALSMLLDEADACVSCP